MNCIDEEKCFVTLYLEEMPIDRTGIGKFYRPYNFFGEFEENLGEIKLFFLILISIQYVYDPTLGGDEYT